MKFVIQRVNNADVTVDNKIVGSIGKGFLILFGACETDTADMLPKFVDKIVKLRILQMKMVKPIFQSLMLAENCSS